MCSPSLWPGTVVPRGGAHRELQVKLLYTGDHWRRVGVAELSGSIPRRKPSPYPLTLGDPACYLPGA